MSRSFEFEILKRAILGRRNVSVEVTNSTVIAQDELQNFLMELTCSPEFYFNWPKNPLFKSFTATSLPRNQVFRPIIHRHIPKTGGTTLNSALRGHFKTENSFVQREWMELCSYPLSTLMHLDFIAGHFGETPAAFLSHRNPFEVALVRDPWEQIPSLYRQYVRGGVVARDTTFQSWLFSEEGMGAAVNNQSRALTINLLTRDQEGDERVSISWEGVQELHSLVKQAVNKMDILGTTDDVESVYVAICDEYKWVKTSPVGRHNVSQEKDALTIKQKNQIDNLSHVDRWLYELAKCNKFSR